MTRNSRYYARVTEYTFKYDYTITHCKFSSRITNYNVVVAGLSRDGI